jgi:hypothetical protein
LWVQSGGAVTLNAVTAHGNEGDGLYLGAFGPVVIRNSTFSGTVGGYGIRTQAESTGAILLDNVMLYKNGHTGALLQTTNNITLKRIIVSDNVNYGIRVSAGWTSDPTGKNVILTDSIFSGNRRNLHIEVNGSITLTNVTSLDDDERVHLSNSKASILAGITLKNVTVMDHIFDHGLYVVSKGNILLNGITATNNGHTNAYISNDPVDFPGAAGSVSVLSSLGVNLFNNSIYDDAPGLEIHTGKNVVLSKVQADGNRTGILIRAQGALSNVTMTDVTASDNLGLGIDIDVSGTITWTRGSANGNGQTVTSTGGALLVNRSSCGIPNVVLRDVTFNNNLNGLGLKIESKGSVTITNLAADDNARGGVLINNAYGLNGKVTITRSLATGFNTIERNKAGSAPGLNIISKGAVYINRLSASFTEAGHGAYIDNCHSNSVYCDVPALAPVTILNSFFNQNNAGGMYSGLYLTASGAVTITGVTASNNGNWGAYIDNSLAAPPAILAYNRPVRVTRGVFVGNTNLEGLYIQTDRAVALNSITAMFNGRHGVWVQNYATSLPGTVTVTGKNLFNDNVNNGLYIRSIGNVVVSGSSALNNGGIGIYITTSSTVTMSSINAMGNASNGVNIYGKVKILLQNMNVFSNGIAGSFSGVLIYSEYGTSSAKIYIYNSNVIGNGGYGLNINAKEPQTSYVFIYNTNLFGNLTGDKTIY